MTGAGFYGKINMILKKTALLTLLATLELSGCGVLPGMQNIDTSQMKTVIMPEKHTITPILIPVTHRLLTQKKIRRYHYQIAPADVLSIHVWQHPEFDFLEQGNTSQSNTGNVQGAAGGAGYLVNSNGYIYFPLIGSQHVAGKTMETARENITHHLKKYVKNPQVNVRVSDYRGQKVYVLGEVNKQGFLPITDQPLTVADAITLSGSLDPNAADPRYIFIIRGNLLKPLIFWLDLKTPDRMLLAEQFSLQPKDILYVSSAPATRWNRMLSQLLPTVQTVWMTQAMINNS